MILRGSGKPYLTNVKIVLYVVHFLSGTIYSSSAQGQILHYKHRNLGCSSAEGRSFTANSGKQGCSFTRDLIGAVASRCFPHPTLSLVSEL